MFCREINDVQAFVDHFEFCIDYGIFLSDEEHEKYWKIKKGEKHGKDKPDPKCKRV